MFNRDEFEREKLGTAQAMSRDARMQKLAEDFLVESDKFDYSYMWTWMGLPLIQMPPDIVATQEIIWKNKPDVIIETGIAWGGSVVFSASMLQLLGRGEVVAVDLNLHDHIASEVMSLPFSNRIHLYKGSSVDPSIVAKIRSHVKPGQSAMVILDSNHTHEHVLNELRAYGDLVTPGQYLVVADTMIEAVPDHPMRQRPWGKGNSPDTARVAYMRETDRFEVDMEIDNKILITSTAKGYLRCIK